MNIETLREFFGWCTVINCGLLVLGLIKVLSLGDWAGRVHAKMFGVDEVSVPVDAGASSSALPQAIKRAEKTKHRTSRRTN